MKNGKARVLRVLYILLQLTWGIIQNIGGALVWLVLTIKKPKRVRSFYHGAIVTNWNIGGSMGLGMFIFFGHHGDPKPYGDAVMVHEYGHTIQSCILGPFFLPIIGLPSLLWAALPPFEKMRQRGRFSYYDFYPERWANYEGKRVLHLSPPARRLASRKK